MTAPFSFVLSLKELFAGKLQQFMSDIDDVHSVWLNEIQQEANRMLTSDFSAEPELMPKTPSQKKNNRRKRISLGYQEETRAKRRFSKGKRSKLRGSSVKTLVLIAEDEGVPQASTSGQAVEQPKRSTRRNKQTQPEVSLEAAAISETPPEVSLEAAAISDCSAEQVPEEQPEVVDMDMETAVPNTEIIMLGTDEPQACVSNTPPSPPNQPPIPAPEVSVRISSEDRRSAELVAELQASPGRNATKIAIAATPTRARRSSVRHSLKLRYSKAGLRHSMTQDAVRRASRRSMLKKKSTRGGNSTCSSNVSDESGMETDGDVEKNRELPPVNSDEAEESEAAPETVEQKPVSNNERITRSMAVNSPLVGSPALSGRLRGATAVGSGSPKKAVGNWSGKRKSTESQEASPTKRPLPPKKSQSAVRPHMRAFLQTVQKNQMLMMTPMTVGRSSVVKSFIKHTTPIKIDPKSRERLKLEALKKKQEQEEERIKKMEEAKRRKQEELKRKRDERLRRVVESRMKEDEEKKKRLEQKMSQSDEKNDKIRVERIAEEKAKKKVAVKRQEELDQKRRVEEEARLQKIQQAEEERRQQELVAKRAAEEEERTRKLAEARRALELRREREQERERQRELEREKELERQRQKELERERQAAAERERAEREKALALQREVERAAREKERRELEEKRQLEERRMREEQQRLAAEKAAREREAAKQKMAAASVALNNVQSSVLKTPVGKGAALNVTMEVENSPQSYSITPKGGNKPLIKSTNSDDYGMDQKSDDSTDDESAPRKPIPSWAEGHNLQQTIMKQYFNPPDLHTYFGAIEPPKLENIFYKSKPRYFKRTSSAVWHSPPRLGHY